MKTRVTPLIALATAALLFAGCAPASPSSTSSTTPSPTASVPAPETPSPSPTPTTPPEDPDDPTTWLITQDGIGPVRLGEPFDEARALLPAGAEHDPEACFWTAWWDSPETGNQIYLVGATTAESDDVGPVDLVASAAYQATSQIGPVTAEGVGAGSTPDEIRAAHPDAVEAEGMIAGSFLQVGRIFFAFPEGSERAASVVVTTAPEPPYEVCG